jgi:hypothetical protein
MVHTDLGDRVAKLSEKLIAQELRCTEVLRRAHEALRHSQVALEHSRQALENAAPIVRGRQSDHSPQENKKRKLV